MSANQRMKAALRQYVIPGLIEQGFTGKYPHYRRTFPDRIELLAFQWNKWGNSFTIEVSVVFTNRQGLAANFTSDMPEVSFSEANVWDTNQRHRLKGMYDGWFYYSDVYCMRIRFHKFYTAVGEKAAASYVPNQNERLVQKADENTYRMVCDEVNKQLKSAYHWWEKMSRKA